MRLNVHHLLTSYSHSYHTYFYIMSKSLELEPTRKMCQPAHGMNGVILVSPILTLQHNGILMTFRTWNKIHSYCVTGTMLLLNTFTWNAMIRITLDNTIFKVGLAVINRLVSFLITSTTSRNIMSVVLGRYHYPFVALCWVYLCSTVCKESGFGQYQCLSWQLWPRYEWHRGSRSWLANACIHGSWNW